MSSTGVLVRSVGCGGVVMVGCRTVLLSEGLAVAGVVVDGGVGGGTLKGGVGVVVVLRWGVVLRLWLRLSLGVDLIGFAIGRPMVQDVCGEWSEVECDLWC